MARVAAPGQEAWLALRTGAALTPAARAVEAVDASGRTRAMVVFDLWTLAAAQAHIALESPAALRCLLPAAADYVFRVAERRLLIGLVPAFNERSLALAGRLGFRETHRVRDGWSLGVDLVVHEMRREECRWWKGEA